MRIRPWPEVKFVTRPPASANPSQTVAEHGSANSAERTVEAAGNERHRGHVPGGEEEAVEHLNRQQGMGSERTAWRDARVFLPSWGVAGSGGFPPIQFFRKTA